MEDREHLGVYFKKINNAIIQDANAQMKKWDITFSQAELLFYLLKRHDKETTSRDIERRFNLKHPTVVGLLQRMEKKGLVHMETSAADHRRKNIILSEKAYAFGRELQRTRQELEERFYRGLTPEQHAQLRELLELVYQSIKQDTIR